jgi:hypothetical protein
MYHQTEVIIQYLASAFNFERIGYDMSPNIKYYITTCVS